jgi:iron complex outermembrane recepter protein
MRGIVPAAAAAAFLMVSAPAYAESVLLKEIEVKGKKETRIETLEVREVRETRAHDLGEALEISGNVGKVRKGGIANDIVIRGYQRDNINVLIDGARIHGACPNRMDPPSFHLDYAEVERVELRKGPYDVSNAGSLGGMVDVKTRGAGPGTHGEFNLGAASFGSYEGSALLSHGTDRFDILAGGAYKTSDPYESGDGRKITELDYPTPANRYRPEETGGTAYDIKTGWAKAGWNPSEVQRIELSYTGQWADDVLYPYLFMDALYDDTHRLNLRHETRGVGPFSRTLLQAYWNDVDHDMRDERRCSSSINPAVCGPKFDRGYSMKTYAEARNYGAKAEGVIGTGTETAIGVDVYNRWWDAVTTRVTNRAAQTFGDNASLPDITIVDVGAYVEHRRPLGKNVRLTAGARIDWASSDAGIDRSAFYGTFYPGLTAADLDQDDVMVSGNIQLDRDLGEGMSLFLGLGRGVRLPDPQERYFALENTPTAKGAAGDPRLDPVVNHEADIGLKYSSGRVLAKAQVFYSDLTDFIVVREADNTVKTYRNVDATMCGGEASGRIALPYNLFASGGISYTRGENDTDNADLSEIPPFRGSAALRYDVGTWFGEVEGVFAVRQSKTDTAVREQATAGWGIVNLKAGYEAMGVRVLAGVRNLFDKQYYEHLSYIRDPFASGAKVPEPGMTLYANVQYAF